MKTIEILFKFYLFYMLRPNFIANNYELSLQSASFAVIKQSQNQNKYKISMLIHRHTLNLYTNQLLKKKYVAMNLLYNKISYYFTLLNYYYYLKTNKQLFFLALTQFTWVILQV